MCVAGEGMRWFFEITQLWVGSKNGSSTNRDICLLSAKNIYKYVSIKEEKVKAEYIK